MSGGAMFNCGIRADDTVYCWGRDPFTDFTPPGTFAQVDSGGGHACGLHFDGTAECWGDNTYGQATALEGTFVELVAEQDNTCGLRPDHSIACWGDNLTSTNDVPAGYYTEVAIMPRTGCGLTADGAIRCWGETPIIAPVDLCYASVCGDSEIESQEQCDDGDIEFAAGEPCDASCRLVPCGRPTGGPGELPRTADALFTLRAGLELASCSLSVCDVNHNGSLTASDALLILQRAVGGDVSLDCSTEGV